MWFVGGYFVLSVVMPFAQEIFSPSTSDEANMLLRLFHSGNAWVLGPPVNLMWRAPLYFGFYCIGTVLCLLHALAAVSQRRLLAKVAQALLFAVTWSACGLNGAYAPGV